MTKEKDIFDTTIEPTGYHVLIFPDVLDEREAPEKTEGGLFIPMKAKDRMQDEKDREQAGITIGTLIKVGPTAWADFDDGLKWADAGDKVCYARYAGFEVNDEANDRKYQIMNDKDIKAVFRGAKAGIAKGD